MPVVATHQILSAIHLLLEHLLDLIELLRVEFQRFLFALKEVSFILAALVKDAVFVDFWSAELVEEGCSV